MGWGEPADVSQNQKSGTDCWSQRQASAPSSAPPIQSSGWNRSNSTPAGVSWNSQPTPQPSQQQPPLQKNSPVQEASQSWGQPPSSAPANGTNWASRSHGMQPTGVSSFPCVTSCRKRREKSVRLGSCEHQCACAILGWCVVQRPEAGRARARGNQAAAVDQVAAGRDD